MKLLSDKILGSTVFSDDWNQMAKEMENIITSQGEALTNSLLDQAAKSLSKYSTDGDFYTRAGGLNALTLTVIGSKQPVTSFQDGMRCRFLNITPTTGALTVNVNSLGVKDLEIFEDKPFDALNFLKENDWYEIFYRESSDKFFVYPATITNNPVNGGLVEDWAQVNSSATDQVGFTVGETIDSTETRLMNGVFRTKSLTNVWGSQGLGGRASAISVSANQTWFCFVIMTNTNLVDYGFDTSSDGSNLLSDANSFDYVYIRNIGAFLLDGSSDILPFVQDQDRFRYTSFVSLQYDMVGAVPEDNFVGIPNLGSLEVDEATIQINMTSLTGGEERQVLTMQNPGYDLPSLANPLNSNRNTDLVTNRTNQAGEEATGAVRAKVNPDSSGDIRFYPRSDPTTAADIRVLVTPISWKVNRRKLQT